MTYPKDLVKLERAYIEQAKKVLAESRRNLLVSLFRLGLAQPALPAVFRGEMESLSRQVAEIGRSVALPVQAAAASQAEADFRRIDLALSFEAAQMATAARRGETVRLLESAAWVQALSARLASSLQNLHAAGESTETAAHQLFDLDQPSVWRTGITTMQLEIQRNLWTVGVGLVAAYYVAAETQAGQPLYRVAQATLDSDTTECCRRVNGQTRRLSEPFELSGTPRFSSNQMHPPFHWNCRTVEKLTDRIS